MAVSTIDALYNGTSEKLTTSATGITVTGTVAATAYTGDGSALTGVGSPSIDDNGNATAMTIDSSERVMLGVTTPFTNPYSTNDGVTFGGTYTWTQVSDAGGQYVQRQNDGKFFTFQKGTGASSVGGIGTVSNTVGIHGAGSGDDAVGLLFVESGSGQRIVPCQENFTSNNGIVNLGWSTNRFKDAYLSGGVYLGGTAAANKLDDVETGNWTPADGSGAGLSLSINAASYIKIGKFVMISFDISWPSTSTTNASSMSGLPFTVANTGAGSLSIGYDTMFSVGGANKWWIGAGSTSAYSFGRTNADMSGGRMIGSGVYMSN
jgi:hypothetical protein